MKKKMKNQQIHSFYKRKADDIVRDEEVIISSSEPEQICENRRIEEDEPRPSKVNKVNPEDIENSLERDPGKRIPIWQYPPNQKDAIRRAYLKWGPYQMKLENYPLSGEHKHPRRFQDTWFSLFPSWLEYSPSEDAAYCLQCYLFSKKPSGRYGSQVFISTGFEAWKNVRNGKQCSFLKHIGKDPCSPHNNAMKDCQDFLNQDGHLRNVIEVQSSSQILNNRLCLKASIDTVRWLTLQACAFRGHYEGSESRNQGIAGQFATSKKGLMALEDDILIGGCQYNSFSKKGFVPIEGIHQ